ncbi:hypothetical protein Lal_00000185 [Lupinus albus]|uniref:Uncharacterized protein n=1 Tax=Lupinus albus TaxID=3870 RepID=A0A6A4NQ81_LUPAL|nr:hypothetical protein Lalb_Chr21g0310181 [Lupinus albus]KAF1860772.1 hypothetical protein Lal_00000185 [Lupinus albus]
MSLVIPDEVRAKAEIYHGDELGQVKSKELLIEVGLPNGLLPLKDIEECGYDRESGFVWLIQKKSSTHKFQKIDRLATYAPHVTANVEFGKIKKLTGVKVREMLVWLTLNEIFLNEKNSDKITFKSFAGVSRTFPVSAFEIDENYVAEGVEEEIVEVVDATEAVEVK